MSASAARRAAFAVALRIERDAAHADELLHSERTAGLSERERAFVTELVMGCLRRRGELDELVRRSLARPRKTPDPEVATALRLGAYQLRHMDRVPAHAAVRESVELVKLARKRSAAGLVNAALRRLPAALPAIEAARLSHPSWLVRRWEAAFGGAGCDRLLLSNLERPETYFRIPAPGAARGILGRLSMAGCEAASTGLPGAYRLVSGGVPAARAAAGVPLQFQDLNSQRVARLVDPAPGGRVLDVCAAPGGKARILAETARVVASDRSPARLRLLRRLGSRGIRLLALDAEDPLPFSGGFDRVLVDAPCSGTGTLARNPEIKWRLRREDIESLSLRQTRILANALQAVAPGGSLVYATCSLEPEENEEVVRAAVGSGAGWRARPLLATLPGRDAGDGFQAWSFRRRDD